MEPRFGHDFSRIPSHFISRGKIQAKLAVNAPGDIYEQEADRVAYQVLTAPKYNGVGSVPLRIQRFLGLPVRRMNAIPVSVDQALASPGRPLQPDLRQDMEQRFGHDFSRVRVHSDVPAGQSVRDMKANAYTVGHDMVSGRPVRAGHAAGRRLIAHELTHVVQQTSSDAIRAGESIEERGLPPVPEPFSAPPTIRQTTKMLRRYLARGFWPSFRAAFPSPSTTPRWTKGSAVAKSGPSNKTRMGLKDKNSRRPSSLRQSDTRHTQGCTHAHRAGEGTGGGRG